MKTLLAHRMDALGIKDRWLSEVTGIERSRITKIRLGTVTPTLEVAVRICAHVAGMRPEDMIVSDAKREATKE